MANRMFDNLIPYSDIHEMNLDWIINAVKEYLDKVDVLEINFDELKKYVMDFFDNLDVQNEINNKLDEMYKSGELSDIIQQYLQISSLLTYNTIADLKNATNLIDGVDALCLGSENYLDGNSNYFKIRTLTSSDVVDEKTILSLTNYPTLIAEKLVNRDKNIINVDEYGAVGDGVSIDTIAFKKAIENGGYIMLTSEKHYIIDDVLELQANTTIDLNNAKITCVSEHLIRNFNQDDINVLEYDGKSNIIIKNGTLINGRMGFIHGKNILIENVNFENCKTDHFIEICACYNFKVINSTFTGMVGNTVSIREYINIDACNSSSFPWLPVDSPTYDGTINEYIIVDNCLFRPGLNDFAYMQDAVGCHSVVGEQHENIIISNNVVIGNSDTQYAFRLENMKDSKCVNNNCKSIYGLRYRKNNNVAVLNNIFECNDSTPRVAVPFSTDYDLIDMSFMGNMVPNRTRLLGGLTGELNFTFKYAQMDVYFKGSSSPTNPITTTISPLLFDTIDYTYGAPGQNTYMMQEIQSFYERNFLVNEKFPVILPNATIGNIVINNDGFSFENNTTYNTRLILMGKFRNIANG